MGYNLQAIIGSQSLLESVSSRFVSALVAPLNFEMALIPVTDELLDEVGASGDAGRFYKLTNSMKEWVCDISHDGPVTYVEAEFFGGAGSQSAVVWKHKAILLEPIHKPDAINQALRSLGVRKGHCRDEFEALGLQRHRNTDDWLDDAIAKQSGE